MVPFCVHLLRSKLGIKEFCQVFWILGSEIRLSNFQINFMAPAKALRGGDGARNLKLKLNLKPKGDVEEEETSTRKPLLRPGGNRPVRKGLTIHRKRALVGAQK